MGKVEWEAVCHRISARAGRSGSSILTYCKSKRAPTDSTTARIAYRSSADQHPKSRMTEGPLTRTSWATQITRPSRMSPPTRSVAVPEQRCHPLVRGQSEDAQLIRDPTRQRRLTRTRQSHRQVEHRRRVHARHFHSRFGATQTTSSVHAHRLPCSDVSRD